MSEPATYVVTFDVANPKRLRRLSRFLEGNAHRVQRSVFEVILSSESITALLDRAVAAERFEPTLDGLRAYRVCPACLRSAQVRGVGPAPLSLRGPLVF